MWGWWGKNLGGKRPLQSLPRPKVCKSRPYLGLRSRLNSGVDSILCDPEIKLALVPPFRKSYTSQKDSGVPASRRSCVTPGNTIFGFTTCTALAVTIADRKLWVVVHGRKPNSKKPWCMDHDQHLILCTQVPQDPLPIASMLATQGSLKSKKFRLTIACQDCQVQV